MSGIASVIVDLQQPQFGEDAFARAKAALEMQGFTVTRGPTSDRLCAWIDQEFGGWWSSLAFVGSSIEVRRGDDIAGFAAFDPQGVLAGPIGVADGYRDGDLGLSLVNAALATLAEHGCTRATMPVAAQSAQWYATVTNGTIVEPSGAPPKRFRTLVLASGNGSNFQSVIDRVQDGMLPLDLAALITNKTDAYAIERARLANIAHMALAWDRGAQSREQYDENLISAIEREAPDLVLLLGWMHLLPPQFFDVVPHAINIHPAFLPLDQARDEVTFPDGSQTPAFRGANAVRDALALGCEWVGASSHRVTLQTDRGPMLARKPLRVGGEGDLMGRLHRMEHEVLLSGIQRWIYEQ